MKNYDGNLDFMFADKLGWLNNFLTGLERVESFALDEETEGSIIDQYGQLTRWLPQVSDALHGDYWRSKARLIWVLYAGELNDRELCFLRGVTSRSTPKQRAWISRIAQKLGVDQAASMDF